MKYRATAELVGNVWHVRVPEIDQHAETAYYGRVEFEARRLIAEHFGVDPDSFDVEMAADMPASWTDPDGVTTTRAMRRAPR